MLHKQNLIDTSCFDPKPYQVVDMKETMVIASRDSELFPKNSSLFNKFDSNQNSYT